MIVKNESKVILRLLESVLPIIDSYNITDTGSIDNTIDIIQDFFSERNIEGTIHKEEFRDFAYNRTKSLEKCVGSPTSDYILLLDADMVLTINPSISIDDWKETLSSDAYYVFQGSNVFQYKNIRLIRMIRNKPGITYYGVTHEYIKLPDDTRYETLDKASFFIEDIGDGGSKTEKISRDIRLLTKGLEETPDDERYMFYLANTYKDAGLLEKAIETYRKRIDMGGWKEEIWYSYYSIGHCYKRLHDMANAIHAWTEAFRINNDRIENIYEIVKYYRLQGEPKLAYMFYTLSRTQDKNERKKDLLFIEKDIYDYKFDYELSIIGYYCNWNNYNMITTCMKVLECPTTDTTIIRNVLSNYRFYVNKLIDYGSKSDIEQWVHGYNIDICDAVYGFYPSTPSICKIDDDMVVVNVRYVNYSVDENGMYHNKDTIETINVLSVFNTSTHNWVKITDQIIKNDDAYQGLYLGLEDIRLFFHGDKLLFNATRGIQRPNGIMDMAIEHGSIHLDSYLDNNISSKILSIKNQRHIEKNWIMFSNNVGELHFIYEWYPLTIGRVMDNTSELIVTKTIETPNFFRHLRGSSNGIIIGDEIWFICHLVSYERIRYYYHIFVVLDIATQKIKKYSSIFTFEGSPIEYTLGMIYDDINRHFIIGYSIMDNSTKFITMEHDVVDDMFAINQ
jgi:tetratricopeptide (TPR) repeat protein